MVGFAEVVVFAVVGAAVVVVVVADLVVLD